MSITKASRTASDLVRVALCWQTLEYKNEHARWIRVKMKTPVEAVKSARAARIIVPQSSSRVGSRAIRR